VTGLDDENLGEVTELEVSEESENIKQRSLNVAGKTIYDNIAETYCNIKFGCVRDNTNKKEKSKFPHRGKKL